MEKGVRDQKEMVKLIHLGFKFLMHEFEGFLVSFSTVLLLWGYIGSGPSRSGFTQKGTRKRERDDYCFIALDFSILIISLDLTFEFSSMNNPNS